MIVYLVITDMTFNLVLKQRKVHVPDNLTTFGHSDVKRYNLHFNSQLRQEIDGHFFSA
jgi:hypothetical protein